MIQTTPQMRIRVAPQRRLGDRQGDRTARSGSRILVFCSGQETAHRILIQLSSLRGFESLEFSKRVLGMTVLTQLAIGTGQFVIGCARLRVEPNGSLELSTRGVKLTLHR